MKSKVGISSIVVRIGIFLGFKFVKNFLHISAEIEPCQGGGRRIGAAPMLRSARERVTAAAELGRGSSRG